MSQGTGNGINALCELIGKTGEIITHSGNSGIHLIGIGIELALWVIN